MGMTRNVFSNSVLELKTIKIS